MKLLSVNVSLPKPVTLGGRSVTTSICKKPTVGRIRLAAAHLEGDGQADRDNHGGFHKAAYAYTIENYDHWKSELGRNDLDIGQFGENFTVEGMSEDRIHVGDVFRIGLARVEVTQPRQPCYKLALRMGIPRFPEQFLASGLVGFYLRVIEEGDVGAGDAIELLEADTERLTIREASHLMHADTSNIEELRKALRIRALSPGWRQTFEKRLARLEGSGIQP